MHGLWLVHILAFRCTVHLSLNNTSRDSDISRHVHYTNMNIDTVTPHSCDSNSNTTHPIITTLLHHNSPFNIKQTPHCRTPVQEEHFVLWEMIALTILRWASSLMTSAMSARMSKRVTAESRARAALTIVPRFTEEHGSSANSDEAIRIVSPAGGKEEIDKSEKRDVIILSLRLSSMCVRMCMWPAHCIDSVLCMCGHEELNWDDW